MSRKGALSNGGWLTVIAKAHLPADVLLWLDMSVFFLWLKRDGEKAQMRLASFPSCFFFLFCFHPQAQSNGCILFCQSAWVCKDANCPLRITLKTPLSPRNLNENISNSVKMYIWYGSWTWGLHGCTKKDVLKGLLGQCCMVYRKLAI